MSERDSLLGVGIGAGGALGLVAALDGFGNAFAGADGPAWVQAVGSVAAILVAVWVAHFENTNLRKERRDGRFEAILVKASILGKLAEISEDAAKFVCVYDNGLFDEPRQFNQLLTVPTPRRQKGVETFEQEYMQRVVLLSQSVATWSLAGAGSAEEALLLAEAKKDVADLLALFEKGAPASREVLQFEYVLKQRCPVLRERESALRDLVPHADRLRLSELGGGSKFASG